MTVLTVSCYFFIDGHKKGIFYNFKILFKSILLILSVKAILYSKAFKYPCYKKNFLIKIQKQGFHM